MKVTYKKILDSVPALRKLTTMDFRTAEAVSLARLIKKLDGEIKIFENVRKTLEKKYKDDVFIKQLTDLLEQECEEYDKITLTLSKDGAIDAATILNSEEFVDFVIREEDDNGR